MVYLLQTALLLYENSKKGHSGETKNGKNVGISRVRKLLKAKINLDTLQFMVVETEEKSSVYQGMKSLFIFSRFHKKWS